MKESAIENIEIELLLEALFKRYGYDFRSYARASVRRRIVGFMQQGDFQTISSMIPRLIHDESFFEKWSWNFP